MKDIKQPDLPYRGGWFLHFALAPVACTRTKFGYVIRSRKGGGLKWEMAVSGSSITVRVLIMSMLQKRFNVRAHGWLRSL